MSKLSTATALCRPAFPVANCQLCSRYFSLSLKHFGPLGLYRDSDFFISIVVGLVLTSKFSEISCVVSLIEIKSGFNISRRYL